MSLRTPHQLFYIRRWSKNPIPKIAIIAMAALLLQGCFTLHSEQSLKQAQRYAAIVNMTISDFRIQPKINLDPELIRMGYFVHDPIRTASMDDEQLDKPSWRLRVKLIEHYGREALFDGILRDIQRADLRATIFSYRELESGKFEVASGNSLPESFTVTQKEYAKFKSYNKSVFFVVEKAQIEFFSGHDGRLVDIHVMANFGK